MVARNKRFTIFDMMEEKGIFDSNPANSFARGPEGENLYKGPVQYPKILYHPKGEERVIVPGELIDTLRGPMTVGEQREIIWQQVEDLESEKKLLAAGWHDHPAKAIAASGKTPPPISSDTRIADLEAKIKAMQAEIDANS